MRNLGKTASVAAKKIGRLSKKSLEIILTDDHGMLSINESP